jgi:hypothetical protein
MDVGCGNMDDRQEMWLVRRILRVINKEHLGCLSVKDSKEIHVIEHDGRI